MIRVLPAVLALSAGLAAAVPAGAQAYQQPYPDQEYRPSQQYPSTHGQPQYGQPRYEEALPGRPYPQGSYIERRDDQRYEGRRDDDRDYQAQQPEDRRTYTTPTYPDRARGDGPYDRRPVDPAPGAEGPYVGHHPATFYNTADRIVRIERRLAGLRTAQRRRAYAEMRSIRAEERTQRAKNGGELRDWDRERLNVRLDALVRRYPGLEG